jgi:diguanylate cyclase (GGDEF)-like protein
VREWDRKRTEEISEHMLVTNIVCFFIFFMIVINWSGTAIYPNLSLNWLNTLTLLLLTLSIIYYIGKKISSGLKLAVEPAFWDFLLFFTLYILSAAILIITSQSGNNSTVKMIFFIPIIIASTSYGKKIGMITAGAASAIIFFFDFTTGLEPVPSFKLQSDIVNCSVMLILAWLIGGLADIEKAARESLTTLANTDDLTGIYNHRHFHDILRQHIKSAKETNRPISLIMFDIDYFKFYNNSCGYQQGDEILRQIGTILSQVVKKPNNAARYGSDEFTVIVPGDEDKALGIAEEIRRTIESYPFEGASVQPKGKITVSMGISCYPKQGKTPTEIIRSADEAMYKAKYSTDKVQVYFTVMDELRDGIAKNERDLFNSIKTLITIINAKDRYTFGHSERVVYYAMNLARQANLTEEEMAVLRYGSFLHDIGKIEIDRELLNKIGPLKASEFMSLKKHPVWGCDIVHPIKSLQGAIPVILHHHENFDGSGYPLGLYGENIPFQARILRIADSFDAMTTDRPYKKAKTVPEACEELIKYKGILFDPDLIDLFVQLVVAENNPNYSLIKNKPA